MTPGRRALLSLAAATLSHAATAAAAPLPPVTQFDLVGFVQAATFDGPDLQAGGTLTVNGLRVVVPRNTVVELPATALTWGELFTLAPAPYGPTRTGLALSDVPTPLVTTEAHVIGNRVGDVYVAGLVSLSQQSVNLGQGYVNYVDYTRGELLVGGVRGDPTSGTRVRINDPIGRFSKRFSPDVRFTIDEDNPTVRAETGYPMCVPRVNPALADDPLCPRANRPFDPVTGDFIPSYMMQAPGPGVVLDASRPAPFEVGDFVTFSGMLVKDGPAPTAGPPSPADTTYVAAWSVVANLGIFTMPGTDPAYVAIDVTILGAGGANVAGAVEATTRTRFEGFSTDPTREIDLYGIDVDPCTGELTDRHWGSVDVDAGPPRGAVRGRWRFRPPTAVLSLPASGTFLPVTREVRARIRYAAPLPLPSGLVAGQYHAPISEYLFPENAAAGAPIVPNNFESFAFLARGLGPWPGGGPSPIPGGLIGQLSPWPGKPAPAPAACVTGPLVPPVADAGPAQAVASGALVTLDGSASRDLNGQPLAYAWTPPAGPPVALSATWVARPTFVAPALAVGDAPVTLTFALVVSDSAGASAPATVTITVNAPSLPIAPVASAGPAVTVPSGALVALDATGSVDPNAPPLPLSFQWTQVGPPGFPVALVNAGGATPVFQAPLVPPGPPVVLTFEVTVTNAAGLQAAARVDVTVAQIGAPIAVVGPPQPALLGAPVQLDGSGSYDPAGLPLTYAWTQVGGPPVTLVGATTATPTFTAPASLLNGATLTFALTVSNPLIGSAPAVATVTLFERPDLVRVLSAVYRVTQARLTVTAFSTLATVQLFLKSPTGGPDVPMSLVGGVPTADLVGVPLPASVTVVSSLGGQATSAITRLR